MRNEELLEKITGFINDIGISCQEGIIDQHTFLPGVEIEDGAIIYDSLMLDNSGDLLHEAGHLAILKKSDRNTSDNSAVIGDLNDEQAERAAIAWSWAALQELNIAPTVVFHNAGYRGGSDVIIDKFERKNYVGVDTLAWLGMTTENEHQNDEAVFPEMNCWLRA